MNLILLFPSDFTNNDNEVRISGRRLHHIRTIQKVKKGDSLQVGLVNGNLGSGVVTEISDSSLAMNVTLTAPPPPPLPVTLILALPRPKTVKKVLQCATALGVKRIIFLRTWRVEKSYWQSPVLEQESIIHECALGLEQACDTVMPVIEFKHLFKPFVEDEVPLLIRNGEAIVCHPYADNKISETLTDKPVTIAFGPEGGFIEYEINLLVQQGFKPVSFGRRIQRVEYAIPFILGKIFDDV